MGAFHFYMEMIIANSRIELAATQTVNIKINETPLLVYSAETFSEKARGLMFKRSLPESIDGMMFSYDEPTLISFWMKETYMDLDLILVDENMTVTEIIKMNVEKNPEFPEKVYKGKSKNKYAIEIKSDRLKTLTIKIGDKLNL